MNFKKFLCSVLMVTVTTMGFESAYVGTAVAAPICTSYTPSEVCAVVKAGPNSVPIPRMQWDLVSSDATDDMAKIVSVANLDRNTVTGNSSASAAYLTADKVPTALNSFPANVPLVIGRYEPVSMTLHVDVFKIEHQQVNGKMTNAVYHANFAPAYGDYWKAMGTYLSPEQRQKGTAVGPNPFAPFGAPGDDSFSNITMSGAMVVLGHAQRYVGAPMSVLVNHIPSTEQKTQKSGGLFRKKVKTTITYYVTPEYYVGAPNSLQGGTTATYCATDPGSDGDCPSYAIASSGVGFMKLEGGNTIETKEKISEWSQTKSGWTLLAIFVFAFVLSFAFAAVGPAIAATGGTAGAISGGFWSAVLGGGTFMDAGLYTAITAAKGGGFGGVYGSTGMFYAQPKALDFAKPPEHESTKQYLDQIRGRYTGALDSAISGARQQFLGNCGSDTLQKNCSGASGIVPRADQYQQFNSVEFVRDNGAPVKAGGF
jgi:hypothetical protein